MIIRDLEGMPEFRRAVEFQNEVWGPGFTEAVPASMQKVARRVGGVVAGAFDESDELVGFVYGITGVEKGELLHWSDILAVRRGLRDGGIGRRLKWHQRECAMELGVRVMRWTFDPLESRNAWLNLERLGAVADEYVRDMYGVSDSPLHRGLGTDRLVVRWDLASPRVVALDHDRSGEPLDMSSPSGSDAGSDAASRTTGNEIATITAFDVVDDAPSTTRRAYREGVPFEVPIPAEIQSLRDADPELALAWREATRQSLSPALDAGFEVSGSTRTSESVSILRLDPPPAPDRATPRSSTPTDP